MEEAFKRLEKKIADELDDQAWNDLQEVYKYIRELENSNKHNVVSKYTIRHKKEDLEKQYKQIEQTSDFIIADVIQPKIEVLDELLHIEVEE